MLRKLSEFFQLNLNKSCSKKCDFVKRHAVNEIKIKCSIFFFINSDIRFQNLSLTGVNFFG